jgi:hypothetical protein
MAVAYVDPATIHDPQTGTVAPAAWGDVVRDDLEALIDPPACAVFNSAVQSVPNSTVTDLLANSELFDNDGMHSTTSNTARITAQKDGRYLIIATALFGAAANTVMSITFRKNGAGSDIAGTSTINSSLGGRVTAAKMFTLVAGDYVVCRGFQTSGGALNITLDEFAATFIARS